jgi:redox-sensitive bicupin YhaK (pirin superfamily)
MSAGTGIRHSEQNQEDVPIRLFQIWLPARSKSSSAAMTSTAITGRTIRIYQPGAPGADLDGFVDALARRIASFARRAIAATKTLIDQVSLPAADRLLDALNSFQTALT